MEPEVERVKDEAAAWNAEVGLEVLVVVPGEGGDAVAALDAKGGQATGVTSLLYLTPPVAALCEWWVFGVLPTPLMWAGMVVACIGVAMVARGSHRPVAK